MWRKKSPKRKEHVCSSGCSIGLFFNMSTILERFFSSFSLSLSLSLVFSSSIMGYDNEYSTASVWHAKENNEVQRVNQDETIEEWLYHFARSTTRSKRTCFTLFCGEEKVWAETHFSFWSRVVYYTPVGYDRTTNFLFTCLLGVSLLLVEVPSRIQRKCEGSDSWFHRLKAHDRNQRQSWKYLLKDSNHANVIEIVLDNWNEHGACVHWGRKMSQIGNSLKYPFTR